MAEVVTVAAVKAEVVAVAMAEERAEEVSKEAATAMVVA